MHKQIVKDGVWGDPDTIESTGFIYSMTSGIWSMREGVIRHRPNKNSARFMSPGKCLNCADEPGVLFNRTVWFGERNDDKAEEILLKKENQNETNRCNNNCNN